MNTTTVTASVQLFVLLIFLGVQSAAIPSGRRLRDIVAEKFPDSTFILGATIGAVGLDTLLGEILNREFGYVTPENDFKQTVIHPEPGVWNFNNAEKWVANVSKNNQIVRVHAPIGPQCSDWAKNDARTPAELNNNLQEFFTAVCSLSNTVARFKYLDVVNETIIKGQWHREKAGLLWECPWYILGQDTDENSTPLYIRKAFEIAGRYAPRLKLIYNQHQIFDSSATETLLFGTIRKLRADGLRVDGIGWQAHIDNGWATADNLNGLGRFIDRCHAENLEFHITEASVYIKEPLTAAQLQLQADTYSKILAVLLEKSGNGKVGWNTWHVSDVYTAHAEWYPSLFDTLGTAKPAYYAIQSVLESHPLAVKPRTVNCPGENRVVIIKKIKKDCFEIVCTTPSNAHHFRITVFSLQGAQIARRTIRLNGAGTHRIEWNPGRQLPSSFIVNVSVDNIPGARLVVNPQAYRFGR
jgi:GH35 family endo-1,4-beta-xylanase